MGKDVEHMTIMTAREKLDRGELSAVELAEHYLANIKSNEKSVSAYLEVFDNIKEQAKAADEKIRTKENVTALTGIPIALKDNILQVGRYATAGSKILEKYRATYDATVVKKLKQEGVVFIGRTNLDEFAMGSSTENSAFEQTTNPYDNNRVPGGSSGGSAAAVSYGGALVALGSDTGGSVRQPASFCGVVGLKPTYGSVSRCGLIALGSSLDVIGPMGRSVGDVEILFDAIKGEDPLDNTSIPLKEVKGKTKQRCVIGVPRHFMEEGIDDDVLLNFNESLEKLRNLGHEIKDITLPNIKHSLAVYYILMPAEASANLSRFDGVKYGLHVDGKNLLEDYTKTRGLGFGSEVRKRILLGTYLLSAGYYDSYYNKAQSLRELITRDFTDVFNSGNVDVVATPTTPTPAFKIGEKSDSLSMYLADIFTVPANLTGMPALSLPSGLVSRDGTGLPVGFQLTALHQNEPVLFALGKNFLGEV